LDHGVDIASIPQILEARVPSVRLQFELAARSDLDGFNLLFDALKDSVDDLGGQGGVVVTDF
jgi:hypothetical protein